MNDNLLHHGVPSENCLNDIITPDNSCLSFIRFGISKILCDDQIEIHEKKDECIILLLSGTIRIASSEIKSVELSRRSVFSERASAVYIPPSIPIKLYAIQDSEIAVIRTDPKEKEVVDHIIIINPEDVRERTVGKDSWRRTVYDVIPVDFPAGVPVVGETFNEPGKWSSSPPHKHDIDDHPKESRHEELYYYRLEPKQGFGFQRIYSVDGELDVTYTIRDGDIVLIPKGYHPVVAGPGYQLYYLWVLAGSQRQTYLSEDPEHSWIQSE